MSTPHPEHFFDQALELAARPSVGAPRQVDVRRAISAAYYGVFHFVLIALADEVVGTLKRGTERYELVYRSLDHRRLRDVCGEYAKASPAARYRRYAPPGGFGDDLSTFAAAILDLQDLRHLADYSQRRRFHPAEAQSAVATARAALSRFALADAEIRRTFLTLLLCPPR